MGAGQTHTPQSDFKSFWSNAYRWPIETFHEFAKHLVGFESAQLRKEEAVKRHFCLSCVAQSLLQAMSGSGHSSERFDFAQNHEQTIGQRLYTLGRKALQQLLEMTQGLLAQGRSIAQIMEVLMPT